MKSCQSLIVVCLLILGHANAATIVVSGDAGDGLVDVNGVAGSLTDASIRPGTGGGSPTSVVRGQAAVFFFQLPTLSPTTIVNANVQLAFLGFEGSAEFNLDLFGLGVRSSTTILASDYYAGTSASGSGTLIEIAFLTPSATAGLFDLPSATRNSFGSYLQSLYNPSGIPLDEFLVLRANPDIPLPEPSNPVRGYLLATADNPNPSLVPELSINIVPEPPSLLLAAFALLAIAVTWIQHVQDFRRLRYPAQTGSLSVPRKLVRACSRTRRGLS